MYIDSKELLFSDNIKYEYSCILIVIKTVLDLNGVFQIVICSLYYCVILQDL